MERSQSYSSFEESNSSSSRSNHNNNNSNMLRGNTSSASLKLLKTVDIRETFLQQHQQLKQQLQQQLLQQQLEQQLIQQHQQHLMQKQHQQQQPQQKQKLLSASQQQHIQESQLRLKMLQRQESTTTYLDEVDYAADLEEGPEDEAEDDELERTLTPADAEEVVALEYAREHTHITAPPMSMPAHTPTNLPPLTAYQKQQQFQQRKPQSAAALIMRANSSTSATSVASGNCCCSSSASSTSGSSSSASIAATAERRRRLKHEESFDSAPADLSPSPLRRHTAAAQLQRDNSVQSDSSRYSSVDSLLESRKPDPEVILINLGFGPIGSDILSRIPKRFLKPSQVRGNDTDAFVRHVQLANTLADHSVLGYRGLTGNPDLPPSSIVAKIMKRFELYQRKKSMDSVDLKQR